MDTAMYMMLAQHSSDSYEDFDRQWRRYKRKIANGEISAVRVKKNLPDYWSGSVLKTMYRQAFKKMWFNNLYADCLFRAFEDGDRIWFQIIYRYYPIPVDALLVLKMLLEEKDIHPVSVLNQRDFRRYQKLVGRPRNRQYRKYLPDIDLKIRVGGRPLVDE